MEDNFTETKDESGLTRKDYYGEPGNQPWDRIKRRGHAPEFAAGNIDKYLNRPGKGKPDDAEKACWYWKELFRMACMLVTDEEREMPLFVQSCYRAQGIWQVMVDELSPEAKARLPKLSHQIIED